MPSACIDVTVIGQANVILEDLYVTAGTYYIGSTIPITAVFTNTGSADASISVKFTRTEGGTTVCSPVPVTVPVGQYVTVNCNYVATSADVPSVALCVSW